MNKRIKELADKAAEYAEDSDGPFDEAYTARFAELIVKDCIETLRLVPYNSDREFGDEVIYQDAVKKYFGVE